MSLLIAVVAAAAAAAVVVVVVVIMADFIRPIFQKDSMCPSLMNFTSKRCVKHLLIKTKSSAAKM